MLGQVIAAMKTGTYEVTRRAATTYLKGVATPGATSTLEVPGVVAPLTGRELDRLPEGERANERRLFLCEVELRVSSDEGGSDTIEVDGETYEVEDVENWLELAGFYKCIIRKEGR